MELKHNLKVLKHQLKQMKQFFYVLRSLKAEIG